MRYITCKRRRIIGDREMLEEDDKYSAIGISDNKICKKGKNA